jgi:hypothetical protein
MDPIIFDYYLVPHVDDSNDLEHIKSSWLIEDLAAKKWIQENEKYNKRNNSAGKYVNDRKYMSWKK